MATASSDISGKRQLARTMKVINVGGKACCAALGILFLANGQWLVGIVALLLGAVGLLIHLGK